MLRSVFNEKKISTLVPSAAISSKLSVTEENQSGIISDAHFARMNVFSLNAGVTQAAHSSPTAAARGDAISALELLQMDSLLMNVAFLIF
ncbi:uncharacterized protein V6R79_013037 [Siganus canaliculatus]